MGNNNTISTNNDCIQPPWRHWTRPGRCIKHSPGRGYQPETAVGGNDSADIGNLRAAREGAAV